MNSFTEKRVTWKRVMMSSWMGLHLPRIAPKATQTEPTQKSALMRLWGDRSGSGPWAAVSRGNSPMSPWRTQCQPLDRRHRGVSAALNYRETLPKARGHCENSHPGDSRSRKQRERERERESVCERDRERERERQAQWILTG